MAFCYTGSKICSPSLSGHRATSAALEAEQSPCCCCHLSLTWADSKATDFKAVSSKTDPSLLWKVHRKRQRRVRTACRSSKIIWHESGAGLKWKRCKEAGQAACIPCRQGTEEGCSLICDCNLSWHSDNKAREKRITLALQFPFFFCRWQTLKFSDCFYAPPCVIMANICRTCSGSLFDLLLSCLRLRRSFSLQLFAL